MAETVKKSRIVSEDDLEGTLMEEFNLRLKNCLSEDTLDQTPESPTKKEEIIYENLENIKTITTECFSSIKTASKTFIETEKREQQSNGHNKENIYENVQSISRSSEYMDMEKVTETKSTKTTTEESIYVDVTGGKDIPHDKPSFLLFSEASIDQQDKNEVKSVKDRMLLASDDTSTLLFTQTVTSPMLTPSEENVDFLKGFRKGSTSTGSPKDDSRSDDSPKTNGHNDSNLDLEVEVFQVVDGKIVEGDKEEVQENIYENLETMDEDIYENVEDLRKRPVSDCFNKSGESLEGSEPPSEDVQEIVSQIELNRTPDHGDDDDVTEISDVCSLDRQVSDSDSSNFVLDGAKSDNYERRGSDKFGVIQDFIESQRFPNPDTVTQDTEVDFQGPVTGYNDSEVMEYIALTEEPKNRSSFDSKTNGTPNEAGDFDTGTKIVDELVKSYVTTKSETNTKNRERDTETVPAKIVQNLTTQFMKNGEERDDSTGKNKKHDVNQLKSVDIMKQINKFEHKDEVTDDKSSFSKFDALQKKNVLHVRSTDSTKAQEKFNGTTVDTTNCKCCGKQVFQMEQMKAEKAIWHKNCFRCHECSKQLNVDTYESHEGTLYCKPHFRALFAPKIVDEVDETPSDKPDLGLEELQSLNVKERFQVFEQHQSNDSTLERTQVNVKRSPSILSKLAKFQSKGMDIGVADESLNGIPIEESSSEGEEEEEIPEGEDPDLVRAKRVQKEKPFHFTGMSDVKNKWEHGEPNTRDERREERKQEIQSIRNKLFMGKQGKMKEAYQEAVMKSESSVNLKKEEIKACDTKTIKERFEKGEVVHENVKEDREEDDQEIFESEISKKSRSLFLQLDANASKPPQMSPVTPKLEVKKAREGSTPEREIYHDPDVVRCEEGVEDSVIAKESHTATKMLNKFRQMEEGLSKEPLPQGPKPLKRFTPPPEPAREEESSSEEGSESEEEMEQVDSSKVQDEDLIEAQKAARAKQLRAKFEKWEAQEIKREQNNSSINIMEEYREEQSQIESTKLLRARFESMRESNPEVNKQPRVKVNRFVELSNIMENCEGCEKRVYPLEKISVHGHLFHKSCFKCKECSTILRMDSYTYNQGRLYCTPHFKRLFITKGNYDSAFGLDGHKEKWNSALA